MAAIVSSDDVAVLVQRTFTDDEDDAVTLILTLMQGELELLVNRPLSPTTFTEVAKVSGNDVFLSKTPVQSVASVTRLPEATLVPSSGYEVHPWGLLMAAEDPTTAPVALDVETTQEVEVVYTGGVSTTDWRFQGARSILLGRIARIVNKVHDDAVGTDSVTQEGYSVKYITEGWTDQELARANRLKRRTLVK